MDRAHIIFQSDNGVCIYDIQEIVLESNNNLFKGEYPEIEIKAKINKIDIDNRFESIGSLYDSIIYNFDIAQKEMLLNLKHQGYIQ